MANKIRAMFIFEMMGKPPEYLKENLESHIKNLESEDIKIISKKIHEPKLLEKENEEISGLYLSFAEVELEIDNLNLLFGLVFRMLPSHIEILEPSDLNLKNFDLSAIVSELAVKLHKYDEIAKILMIDRDKLAMKLNALNRAINSNVKVQEINNKVSSTSSNVENSKLPDDNLKKGKKKKENKR